MILRVVKFNHFPRNENNKYLKPPRPSSEKEGQLLLEGNVALEGWAPLDFHEHFADMASEQTVATVEA